MTKTGDRKCHICGRWERRSGIGDAHATSHAGRHGDFDVAFELAGTNKAGWYVTLDCKPESMFGPYATSQAAFGSVVEAIDKTIRKESADG